MIDHLNILVTGGAGFIGSNIVETLLRSGVKRIRVLDNLVTGKIKNIQFLMDSYDNLEFMYGDVANLETCRRAVKGIDAICHQAALGSVPRSVGDPLPFHVSNVSGFLNVLMAAKEAGIARVVYASSSSVYGDNQTLPKLESRTGAVLSPYAATKHIDETYAGVFTKCYDMECIGLRYFNIFGARQDPNGAYAAVIPKFVTLLRDGQRPTINGDGSFSRDFTHVSNAVRANILGLTTTNSCCFGEAFNIGAGERTSLLELVDVIQRELGSNLTPVFGPGRVGDIPHSHADIGKAQRLLGYEPETSFRAGMSRAIRYYCSNKNHVVALRDVDYDKLVGRPPIHLDLTDFRQAVSRGSVLVTGGCGSIGSEIVRQLTRLGVHDVIVYDNSECGMFDLQNELRAKYDVGVSTHPIQLVVGDVRDRQRLNELFERNDVRLVFHAAAYKHVPLMESNPAEAIKTNVVGSKNVSDLAALHGVDRFVLVSTDKAVNPTNVMGASKRLAELYTSELNGRCQTRFIITRFGNVLGSSGSVIPTFLKKLNNRESLLLTHKDITRYFMTIPEAAQLVIQASHIGVGGDVLLFDMGEPIKIHDLAKRMIELYGEPTTKIVISGLRPGEKVHEELVGPDENAVVTANKKIMRLEQTARTDKSGFSSTFEKIASLGFSNRAELDELLKRVIPGYNPGAG